jgi:hypothetical protein
VMTVDRIAADHALPEDTTTHPAILPPAHGPGRLEEKSG